MSRINTNVQSLIAQRILGTNNGSLTTALERLSTGAKINRGKDDPAGLIVSENLRLEQKALNQAIANSERADQVVNIAEGGLQEVSSLLTELQGLLTNSASSGALSVEEKQANQLQVDSILQTIDRVASSTNFQGMKLLNGSFDFRVSGVAAGVADFRVNGAKFQGDSLDVDMQVTASAQQAGLFLSAGFSSLQLGGSADDRLVLEIAGTLGSRELSFASATSLTSIAESINTYKDVTGVEASVSGTGIKLFSTEFGSGEFVTVKVLDDGGIAGANSGIHRLQTAAFGAAITGTQVEYSAATNGITDEGQNLGATINGIAATSIGKTARLNTDLLDVEITLTTAESQGLGNVGSGADPAFTITGGGATFQIAGKVDIAGQVSIGMQAVASRKLGDSTLGFLDTLGSGKDNNVIDGSAADGQKIVAKALKQVSSLRGRLGAFQKITVGATVRSLGISLENTSAAQSIIRDSDFAAETAALTRSQILVAASTNVLSLANQQPNAALQLLG